MVGTPKNSVGANSSKTASARSCSKRSSEPHATAARQPGADAVAEAVDVKERQHGEVAVGRGDPPGSDHGSGVRREVAAGEHRALGAARRTRRVDEGRGRLRADDGDRPIGWGGLRRGGEGGHVPHGHAGRDEVGEVRGRDHGRRVGVADDVGDLALAVEHVDRDEAGRRASRRPGTDRGTRAGWPAGPPVGPRPAGRARRARAPSGCCGPPSRRRSASPPGRRAGRGRARPRQRGRGGTRRRGGAGPSCAFGH